MAIRDWFKKQARLIEERDRAIQELKEERMRSERWITEIALFRKQIHSPEDDVALVLGRALIAGAKKVLDVH